MLITEKDEQTVEFQRSSNEGERSRSTKHHEQARHPILTSQGGKNDRNETRNRARISTQGQWRPSSGGDEDAIRRGKEGRDEGKMRTWIWIGARPAGGEGRAVGRHDEVGRSGEDAAALGIGEGQRGGVTSSR